MIHESAVIGEGAELGENVEVGPFCVVEPGVKIGAGTKLHSHVAIHTGTTIGKECEFFPFTAIGIKTQDLKYAGEPTFCEIGDRNVFRENVTIHRGTEKATPTRIGDDNLFLCYSHVAHDCQLGSHIIMSNSAGVAGHVEVDDYAIISAMSGVHQFCKVGAHAIIGGLGKVVQDVPPFMIADGNPVILRGVNQVGLQRRGFSEEDVKAIKMAYKKLFFKKEGNLTEAVKGLESHECFANEKVREVLAFVEASERGVVR